MARSRMATSGCARESAKYADWAMKNNSLLIVTWDEDSDTSYRKKLHCPAGITTSPPQNRVATILDMAGLPPFAGAVTAKDITAIWK